MPQLPRMWISSGRALVLLLALAFSPAALAQSRPQRVVSINLCADQLLLRLADRDQIASLSPLARDSTISFLSREARDVPVNDGRAESILFSDADLVLAGPYDPRAKRELLQRRGIALIGLDLWQGFAQGYEQIRTVAARLGHPERGEALIDEIEAALARTKNIVPKGRTLLIYHRRGWVPDPGSLIGELARHMGFTLHQEKLGMAGGGFTRLEAIVAAPPDYLLVDEVAGRSIDNGSALLVHPALDEAVPPGRRLAVADRLTICEGPSTPAAIEALAAEVRAKVR